MREVLPLSAEGAAERVLTIAILPNIARCQSVLGVARELGAIRSALDKEKAAQAPATPAEAETAEEEPELPPRWDMP